MALIVLLNICNHFYNWDSHVVANNSDWVPSESLGITTLKQKGKFSKTRTTFIPLTEYTSLGACNNWWVSAIIS